MKKVEYEVKVCVKIGLTAEDIEDIVVTALEGGIGYWACLNNIGEDWENAPKDEAVSETAARLLMEGKKLEFLDEEDRDTVWTMSLDDLLKGIKMFVEEGYDRYGAFVHNEFDGCMFDAEGADIVFQLAMFGEIVYG